MKKLLIFLFIINSAEALNLDECFKLAVENYPLKKNIQLQQNIHTLKTDNLNARYYPEINLFGQAQYQSDVTKIDIDLPFPLINNIKLPEMTKDQYKVGININQLIWDGGIISNQKSIESVQSQIETANLDVELYKLKDKVTDAYFNILLLIEKQKSLETLISDLKGKINIIRSRVENGVVLPSNLYILEAELIKTRQGLSDILTLKKTSYQVLGELINKEIDEKTTPEIPSPEFENNLNVEKKRPEYQVFSLTGNNIQNAQLLTDSKYMPKFSAYIQGAYAKPGLDMFDPDFASYYIVGLKANWNIWNWNTASREKQIFEVQNIMIKNQEQTFTKNLTIAGKQYINQVQNLEKQIEDDKQIIELRSRIIKQSFSQLENGIITSTEYIAQLNAEYQAKLNLEYHKIELVQTKVKYLNLIGNVQFH